MPRRVLVIDDESAMRFTLEAVLGDASREQAKEKMAELDACAHAVLAFLQDEVARDWLRPQPPAGNARLESSSEAS